MFKGVCENSLLPPPHELWRVFFGRSSHESQPLHLVLLGTRHDLREGVCEHVGVGDVVGFHGLGTDEITNESGAYCVPTRVAMYPVRGDAVDRSRAVEL